MGFYKFYYLDILQVFVANNDVYYQENPVTEAQQLTFNGLFENVHNGVPDWLYEGEKYDNKIQNQNKLKNYDIYSVN